MVGKVSVLMYWSGDVSIGSIRIPYYAYRHCFERRGRLQISTDASDIYENYDVAFLPAGTGEPERARRNNPNLYVCVTKPHVERRIANPFERAPIAVKWKHKVQAFMIPKGAQEKQCARDIQSADLLICETPQLTLKFNSMGFSAHYAKLIEELPSDFQPKTQATPIRSDNVVRVVYHGNTEHIFECEEYIVDAMEKLAESYRVELSIITDIKDLRWKKQLSERFVTKYIQYSYPDILYHIRDHDIGLVPNQVVPRGPLISKLIKRYGAFFWRTHQVNDITIRYKQSANAGRAFVFAQAGVPFVACPCPDLNNIFGELLNGKNPLNGKEWTHAVKELVRDHDERERMSVAMRAIVNEKLDLDAECEKVEDKIIADIGKNI